MYLNAFRLLIFNHYICATRRSTDVILGHNQTKNTNSFPDLTDTRTEGPQYTQVSATCSALMTKTSQKAWSMNMNVNVCVCGCL